TGALPFRQVGSRASTTPTWPRASGRSSASSAATRGVKPVPGSKHAVNAKLLIIGSGPAGYSAAIYAARAMLDPILIQGIAPGGQLTITTDVENYPGYADVIQGPWLMEQMQKQAAHVGTKLVADHVNKVDLGERPFRVECESGDIYLADTLILAT